MQARARRATAIILVFSVALMAAAAAKQVVIVGGGISGVSTAFYLAKRGVKSTLIDPVGIAPAASGKAGGFLALDWTDGSPMGPLARKSFALHEELAEAFGAGAIDYRRLTCEAVAVDGGARGPPSQKKVAGIEWVDLGALGSRPMGGTDTIAQVHPKKLTEALWAEATRLAGSELRIGRVSGVEVDAARAAVVGVAVEGAPPQPCDGSGGISSGGKR